MLKSGKIIHGANIENASYGGAICAERTALVQYASSPLYHGKPRDTIAAIAVSSDLDEPCSPCGICRQFIREFCALDMPILMVNTSWKPSSSSSAGQGGASETAKPLADPYGEDAQTAKELLVEEQGVTIRTLEQLLPLSFGPEQLER